MSNPWKDLREQAAGYIAAVDAIPTADAVNVWRGEDDESLFSLARRYGCAAWLRIPDDERAQDPGRVTGRVTATLEVVAVAASMRDRQQAAEAAEQLAWDIRDAIHAVAPTYAYQREAWLYRGRNQLFTSPTAVAFRLRFTSPVDLDAYSEF